MRVSRILTAVASATIVTTITTNPTASARDRTHRADSTHSVIVWSRFVDSDFSGARIVAKSPHGHRTRVLSDPGDGVQDIDPEVSPDGQRVAFERDLPDGSTQIVVMGSNGRYEHALDLGCVDPCEVDLSPTWSRDSRHLFFTRVVGPFNAGNAASAVLYRTDLDGAHITRVSEPGIDGTFEDYSASVAPGGIHRLRPRPECGSEERGVPDELGRRPRAPTHSVETQRRSSRDLTRHKRADAGPGRLRNLRPWGAEWKGAGDRDGLGGLFSSASHPLSDLADESADPELQSGLVSRRSKRGLCAVQVRRV